MNKITNVEISICVVIMFIVFFGTMMAGYNTGYKSGQTDALMGKYKYQLETNVVVNIKDN